MTVAISTLYMPETRGADLETSGGSFGAGDLPVLQSFRKMMSKANSSLRFKGGRVEGVEATGIELETRR